MDEGLKKRLLAIQRDELTEHFVYERLSRSRAGEGNRETLAHISEDERRHYEFWAEYTGERPEHSRWEYTKYVVLARLFGITFAVKLMERGEASATENYHDLARLVPEAADIAEEEDAHERKLMAMIKEERLDYVGSMVLGLSDALVELTGALAGFTLALANSKVIAMTGLITGVAAAMSMAASQYLAMRADETNENAPGRSPGKASLYTGVAYIITVAILIAPFLLLGQPIPALLITLAAAVFIILGFTYYVSVALDVGFWKRFLEMAGLSLGVAAVSFGVGWAVRATLGVDI